MNESEFDESQSTTCFPLCFGHNTDYESDAKPLCDNCALIKQCTVATLMKHGYKDVPWYTHLR